MQPHQTKGFDKGLISKICKELIELNSQKAIRLNMGKETEQKALQRHISRQQVNEKLLNITNHQGNARQELSAGEGVEKREPLYTVGGNVTCCSHYGGSSKD